MDKLREYQSQLPKKIFLIRHARPEVEDTGLFTVESARKYIVEYDTAEVEAFILQHEAIPFQEINEVFCSTLVRSQLTAKAIFGEQVKLRVDKAFREFERRIFTLPFVKLPIKLWLVSARLLWFLGFNNKGIETFKEARERARECAKILEADAYKKNTTVLVAHGLLNNFIVRELKKLGWKMQQRNGHDYLSVTVLQQ